MLFLEKFLDDLNKKAGIDLRGKIESITPLLSKKQQSFEIEFTKNVEFDGRPYRRVVVKEFQGDDLLPMDNEMSVLGSPHAERLGIPRLLCACPRHLVLEYVEGRNLCDVINEVDENGLDQVKKESIQAQKEEIIASLARWMADFHHVFRESGIGFKTRGDAHLRNFLLVKGTKVGGDDAFPAFDWKIFGVDFEECSFGDPFDEICELLDSILITNPGIYMNNASRISWKFNLCREFLDVYLTTMEKKGYTVEVDLGTFIKRLFSVMGRLAIRRNALEVLLSKELELIDALERELRSCFIML